MTALVTADVHLNDLPRDSYRWDILPWLEHEGFRLKVDIIIVVGDVTDAKDRHSAKLVNRLHDFLRKSANQWIFVTGNHDFIDPGCPFFGFLDSLDNVRWIREPIVLELPVAADYTRTLLLPASKDWEAVWPAFIKRHNYPYIFLHGTFEGTLSETGFPLPGMPIDLFDPHRFGRIYAGDIHVPGNVAPRIESIGSPHRVRFGDKYRPRVVYIDKRQIVNLYPDTLMRHTIEIRRIADLKKFTEEGPDEIIARDQVKIRVKIKRSEFPEWRNIRNDIQEAAEALGWEVAGVELLAFAAARQRLDEDEPVGAANGSHYKSPRDYIVAHAAKHDLKGPALDVGLKLFEEAANKGGKQSRRTSA